MNENELANMWAALAPTVGQRRRCETRVRVWLNARESSLVAEWWRLIKIHPVAVPGFATVAASLVLIVTPLSWVAFAVL